MEQIILRRLTLASADAGAGNVDPYTVFFSSAKVILPTSKEERTWDSFILKSARERPRDAIQLIGRLIDKAKASGHQTIGSRDAEEAMKIYSRERIDDLTNEFGLDCPVIRTVVESFAGGDFEMTFEVLRKHLRTIGSRASVVLRGRTIQSEDDDAIRLLALLHESGFLNARVADKRKPRGFDHVLFLDEPTLVSLENWNRLQAMTWEIHPAFRTHLIQMRKAQEARN
jgi:hypothetical protein